MTRAPASPWRPVRAQTPPGARGAHPPSTRPARSSHPASSRSARQGLARQIVALVELYVQERQQALPGERRQRGCSGSQSRKCHGFSAGSRAVRLDAAALQPGDLLGRTVYKNPQRPPGIDKTVQLLQARRAKRRGRSHDGDRFRGPRPVRHRIGFKPVSPSFCVERSACARKSPSATESSITLSPAALLAASHAVSSAGRSSASSSTRTPSARAGHGKGSGISLSPAWSEMACCASIRPPAPICGHFLPLGPGGRKLAHGRRQSLARSGRRGAAPRCAACRAGAGAVSPRSGTSPRRQALRQIGARPAELLFIGHPDQRFGASGMGGERFARQAQRRRRNAFSQSPAPRASKAVRTCSRLSVIGTSHAGDGCISSSAA